MAVQIKVKRHQCKLKCFNVENVLNLHYPLFDVGGFNEWSSGNEDVPEADEDFFYVPGNKQSWHMRMTKLAQTTRRTRYLPGSSPKIRWDR